MTIKDELLGKRRTGNNHWMKNEEFIEIVMDDSIPTEDKQRFFDGQLTNLSEYRKTQTNDPEYIPVTQQVDLRTERPNPTEDIYDILSKGKLLKHSPK